MIFTSSIRAKQKAKRDRIIFKLSMLGWTQEEIAEVTGISDRQIRNIVGNNGEIAKISASISDWLSQGKTVEEIASVKQQQRASEKQIVMRLSRLGWAQEEIGQVIGKDRSRVSQIVNNMDFHIIHNSYQEGKSVEEIASFNEFVLRSDFAVSNRKVKTINDESFGRPVEKDYYLSEEGLCLAIMECRKPEGIVIKRQVGFRMYLYRAET